MRQPFQKSGRLQVGREYPTDEEVGYTEEMIANIKGQLKEMYSGQRMQRQAHPKMHGCVKAEFIIEKGLPKELQVGVFSQERSYPAWIRFSNASTTLKPDAKKDVRGMAIKLMDVPGQKLLLNEMNAGTQDFLLINHPTFLAKNVGQFHKTIKAVTGKKSDLILYFLNPAHWGILLRTVKSFSTCTNLLETAYYSTTPYQFGDVDRAVKYFVHPSNNNIPTFSNEGENYLRANLKKMLAGQEAYFNFYIQFQQNAYTMPIEDPTVIWNAPYIKVATIKIPAQTFDTDEQNSFGENLSYTPWHSLPPHRPLGSLNRARKRVYESIAHFRLHANGVIAVEPDPSSFQKINGSHMDPQTNEQVVKQLFLDFSTNNTTGIMAALSPDIVWNEPGAPEVPFGGNYKGYAGIQEMFEKETAVTLTSFTPKMFFSKDDMVVVLGSDSATVKATQKSYETDWTMAFTLSNSKITSVQVYMDTNAIAKAFQP